MQRAALRRGLILEIGGRDDCVVRLLPPLNVSRRTVTDALAIIRASIASVDAELTLAELAQTELRQTAMAGLVDQ